MNPSQYAKKLARTRAVAKMGDVGKVISNPTIYPGDVLSALAIETAARVKLEKEVASLKRKLNALARSLTQ